MGTVHNAIEALLTEQDVARLTKRSLASVRRDRLLRKGCPYCKIGASVRYKVSEFESWLLSLPKRGTASEAR